MVEASKPYALLVEFQGNTDPEFESRLLEAGGLAVLPLATIAKTRKSELVRILDRIEERLETEAPPARADLLRTATFVLMGIKFDKIFVEKLMSRNVLELSSTYQALHQEAKAEGRADEARRLILRIGTCRLGVPTAERVVWLETLDLEALEAIADYLTSVESWEELEVQSA